MIERGGRIEQDQRNPEHHCGDHLQRFAVREHQHRHQRGDAEHHTRRMGQQLATSSRWESHNGERWGVSSDIGRWLFFVRECPLVEAENDGQSRA